jgi:AcrR family transcriptional regulator
LALTPTISEVPGRITRAAVALFSKQGYHGTGTREIARLADVSEVTVFRYFEHKEDIFLAALQLNFGSLGSRLDLFARGSEFRTPESMLPQILSLLVDTATLSPELMKLVAVAFVELHGKAEDVCLKHLAPLFTSIASYLNTNMESGKLRKLNPSIVTAAIVLTVIAQPELSKLVAGSAFSRLGGRDSIDEYTKFWLKVLMPSASETACDAESVDSDGRYSGGSVLWRAKMAEKRRPDRRTTTQASLRGAQTQGGPGRDQE